MAKNKIDIHDSDTVSRVVQVDTVLSSKFKPIFDDMNRNYNMMVSKLQWPEDIKREFEENDRPANSYNILSPVAKYLSSMESGGRKRVFALPTGIEDVELARTVTKLLDTLHRNAKFDFFRGRAFMDAIIARWGWIMDVWSYDNDPNGELFIEAISPLLLKFDMEYSDITLKRCRHVLYSPYLSLDDIVNQYATNDKELLSEIMKQADSYFPPDTKERKKFLSTALRAFAQTMTDFFSNGHADSINQDLRSEDWFNAVTGKFKVLELHERRTERRMMLFDPAQTKYLDITDSVLSDDGYTEDNELLQTQLKKYPNSPEPRWTLVKQIWVTTVIPALNLKVYDAPYPVQNGNFIFTPVFAYDFHTDMSLTQSVMDELIDLQSDYNKTRSIILEMLIRFSNTGYLVEETAIEGFEGDYEGKKIGAYKRVKDGRMGSIQSEQAPQIPRELFVDANERKNLIEYISGATMNSAHGMSESAQETGKLFIAKRDASSQMVQHLFDNLDESTIVVYENSLANVQKFMTSERIFRITEDIDNPEFLKVNQPQLQITPQGEVVKKILNDVTIGKFDLIMSKSPYGQTAREIEFLKLVDIFKFAIEVDAENAKAMLPIVIKASDSSYAGEMIAAMDSLSQAQSQQQKVSEAMMALQSAFQKLGLQKEQLENQGKAIENQGKVLENRKKQTEINNNDMMQAMNNIIKQR